jgi:hypothetical protein
MDSVTRDYDFGADRASVRADYLLAGPAERAIEEPFAAVEVKGDAALVAAEAAAVDDGAVGQLVAGADAVDEAAADSAPADEDRRNAVRAYVLPLVSQARRRRQRTLALQADQARAMECEAPAEQHGAVMDRLTIAGGKLGQSRQDYHHNPPRFFYPR